LCFATGEAGLGIVFFGLLFVAANAIIAADGGDLTASVYE